MRLFSTIILVVSFSLISCQGDKLPGDILPPEKMQAVFWDYLRADVFSNDFGTRDTLLSANEINIKMQKRIFKMHGVDKETFEKSYKYYLAHRDLMKEMIDTMIVRHPKESPVRLPTKGKEVIDSVSIK